MTVPHRTTASTRRGSRRSSSRARTPTARATATGDRRSPARVINARPSSRTLVNIIPERSSACMGTALAISSSSERGVENHREFYIIIILTLHRTTGTSRATSRPRASRSSAAVGAVPGADPVPAARRGAGCASGRAWRRDTGTDSAFTLQLPSFTGRFRRRGRSKKYPGKISRVHADGTFDVACTTRCPCPRRAAFNGLSTHRRRRRIRDASRSPPHHGARRRGQRFRPPK